jgi:hypothetical protein
MDDAATQSYADEEIANLTAKMSSTQLSAIQALAARCRRSNYVDCDRSATD